MPADPAASGPQPLTHVSHYWTHDRRCDTMPTRESAACGGGDRPTRGLRRSRIVPSHVTFDRGLLRVADDRVFSPSRRRFARTLDRHLRTTPGVISTRFDLDGGCLEVHWAVTDADEAARAFVSAVASATRSEAGRRTGRLPGRPRRAAPAHGDDQPARIDAASIAGSPPLPATIVRGPRRALYVAAGGGCLMMTVVGVVVPGIPTVPFLLGASYFLARSSRTLHTALVTTPVVGRVVREWDAHRGISLRSKLTLAGLTVGVVLVTVSLTAAGPMVVGIVAVVVSISLVGIARIPGISPDRDPPDRLLPEASRAPRRLPLLPGRTVRGADTPTGPWRRG